MVVVVVMMKRRCDRRARCVAGRVGRMRYGVVETWYRVTWMMMSVVSVMIKSLLMSGKIRRRYRCNVRTLSSGWPKMLQARRVSWGQAMHETTTTITTDRHSTFSGRRRGKLVSPSRMRDREHGCSGWHWRFESYFLIWVGGLCWGWVSGWFVCC